MESVLEHRIEAAGHRTRALEVAGNGPGIVLLHGWSDSADTWRPLLAQLGSRGRRAIAVDLPGFGEATRLQRRRRAAAAGRLRRRPRRALGGRRAGRGRRHLAGRLPRAAAGRDPRRAAARGRRDRRAGRAGDALVVRPDRGGPDRPQAAGDPGPGPGRARAPREVERLPPARLPARQLDAARGRRRLRARRRDARGPRGAARVRPRARAGALHRPVRPGRHPLPRAAGVGRARPDAAAHRRPARARLAARRRRSS